MAITNFWLSQAKKQRILEDLSVFIGKNYRECAEDLVGIAFLHEDWQINFVIYSSVNNKDEIESIEIRDKQNA